MENDAEQHDQADREAILARLYADGLGPIRYPGADGCAGSRTGFSGPPGACQLPVTGAAHRHYRYPRPTVARIFLCARHGELENVEPMTDDDREELARRRADTAYWRGVVERQRRAAGQASRAID